MVLRQFRGSKITKTFCHFSGKPSTTRQSVSEESREHKVDATEIFRFAQQHVFLPSVV